MSRAATDKAGFPHRTYPCDECPFRADNTDNPDSQFPSERWQALGSTVRDADTGEHPAMGDAMFACHKGAPGAADTDLACAGWLALYGHDHVRVRLALALGQLEGTALAPGENWPVLHGTWSEVVEHHTNDD